MKPVKNVLSMPIGNKKSPRDKSEMSVKPGNHLPLIFLSSKVNIT